jgi:hypothetical protein
MAVSPSKIKDMTIGGAATLIALVIPYAASMSVTTLLNLRDALSGLFAVAVALAIPAQLAWRARRMAAEISLQSFQATVDAVSASCSLAQQADCGLAAGAGSDGYFQGVYNQSQIDHAIRRLDGIDLRSMPNASCRAALDSARRNLHLFFGALRHASNEFSDSHRIPDGGMRTLHLAYEICAQDADTLQREFARMNFIDTARRSHLSGQS